MVLSLPGLKLYTKLLYIYTDRCIPKKIVKVSVPKGGSGQYCIYRYVYQPHLARFISFILLEVTNRIVEMWQKGLLDATVAMQLLGQGVGAAETPLPKTSDIGASGGHRNDNKKRPIESVNPDVSPEDLDECLAQAKRAKMETLVELVVYCIHDTFFFWGITLDDP